MRVYASFTIISMKLVRWIWEICKEMWDIYSKRVFNKKLERTVKTYLRHVIFVVEIIDNDQRHCKAQRYKT